MIYLDFSYIYNQEYYIIKILYNLLYTLADFLIIRKKND